MNAKNQTTAIELAKETSLVQQAETISSVLAAREEAMVKARATVALGRPRNIEAVRQTLLRECEREGFAEVAYYRIKNRGEGFSIHFARAAMRAMGNLECRAPIIYDDDSMRIIEATVTDLESNSSVMTHVMVKKTVERRFLNKGEVAISQRLNSDGKVVYTRAATEEEVSPKQNAMVSKAKRNEILDFLPGDIQFECKRRILKIWDGDKTKDPKEQIRKIIDTFAGIGVPVDELVKYLGHKIETCSPAELQTLRDLVRSIRAGETTWHAETTKEEPDESDDGAGETKPKTQAELLKEQLEKERTK